MSVGVVQIIFAELVHPTFLIRSTTSTQAVQYKLVCIVGVQNKDNIERQSANLVVIFGIEETEKNRHSERK